MNKRSAATLRPEGKPTRSEHVTWEHFGQDIIAFHPISKQYFIFNTVAARIWELCNGQLSIRMITSTVRNEFNSSAPQVDTDVIETIEGFVELGLLNP